MTLLLGILPCQLDHVGNQPVLVSTTLWDVSLRRAVLPQHAAGTPLRHVVPGAHMIDAGAAASGAQGLRPFRPETVHRTISMTVFTPFAASVRMSLSRVRSDTARLSRSFSFWNRFSSFN